MTAAAAGPRRGLHTAQGVKETEAVAARTWLLLPPLSQQLHTAQHTGSNHKLPAVRLKTGWYTSSN